MYLIAFRYVLFLIVFLFLAPGFGDETVLVLPEVESQRTHEIENGVKPENVSELYSPISESSRRLVVLFHGFLGNPTHLTDLVEHFQRRGFYVFTPLIPGHGGDYELLSQASYEDWQDNISLAVKVSDTMRSAGLVDQVFVGGHSLGGTLALLLSKEMDVDGFFLFDPLIGFGGRVTYLESYILPCYSPIPTVEDFMWLKENTPGYSQFGLQHYEPYPPGTGNIIEPTPMTAVCQLDYAMEDLFASELYETDLLKPVFIVTTAHERNVVHWPASVRFTDLQSNRMHLHFSEQDNVHHGTITNTRNPKFSELLATLDQFIQNLP